MTVKELQEKLQAAFNPDTEVIINTMDGEKEITDVIGHLQEAFYIDTVSSEKRNVLLKK